MVPEDEEGEDHGEGRGGEEDGRGVPQGQGTNSLTMLKEFKEAGRMWGCQFFVLLGCSIMFPFHIYLYHIAPINKKILREYWNLNRLPEKLLAKEIHQGSPVLLFAIWTIKI